MMKNRQSSHQELDSVLGYYLWGQLLITIISDEYHITLPIICCSSWTLFSLSYFEFQSIGPYVFVLPNLAYSPPEILHAR